MILTVQVIPNASRDALLGYTQTGTLRVSVKAPARDGKANTALIQLLAKEFRIAKSLIRIKRGAGARIKHVELPDESRNRVNAAL